MARRSALVELDLQFGINCLRHACRLSNNLIEKASGTICVHNNIIVRSLIVRRQERGATCPFLPDLSLAAGRYARLRSASSIDIRPRPAKH